MVADFFRAILYTPLFNLLVFFAWLIPGHSIGWSIIIVTLIVKAILWVPSAKSIRSPIQMRQYQDEIKELQDRHKDNKAAQSQALMAFYKEKGINPLSGCLPLLIQLPVIFVLYRVFIAGLGDVHFDLVYSFVPHLDAINTHFFGIDLAHPSKIVLPIIAGGLQFLQSRHMMLLNPPSKTSKDPTAMMQKQMMYLFPVMTYFIASSLPAGLALYWATNALVSTAQQEVIRRTYHPTEPKVKVTVRTKNK
ncbi:MAG: YidC/Oxa1 family membrane protein insertase [Patescibacteria group bacterium]